MSEKKIQLTEQAELRLDAAVNSYRERLIESLEENKFVPGETVVAITGSDVEHAVDDLRYGNRRRIETRKLYSQMALMMGGALLIFGFMYPTLRDAFTNPPQAILLGGGLYLLVGGLMLYRLNMIRDRSTKESARESLQERVARLELLLKQSALEQQKEQITKIGIGAALLRAPPTPPSKRVRTRRFAIWEQTSSRVLPGLPVLAFEG